MSLKITIEVDGTSEQQIAPTLGHTLTQFTRTSSHAAHLPSPKNPQANLTHENTAALQQAIRQLVLQNQQLQAQAYAQQQLAPAHQLPAAAQKAPAAQPNRRPPLPHQYQPSKPQIALRWLQQTAIAPLRWLWTSKGLVLLFIAMSGGVYGTVMAAPKVSRFLWPAPEFTESNGEKPGATQSVSKATEPASAPKPAPDTPTSKAGSNPPPPAAFRSPE